MHDGLHILISFQQNFKHSFRWNNWVFFCISETCIERATALLLNAHALQIENVSIQSNSNWYIWCVIFRFCVYGFKNLTATKLPTRRRMHVTARTRTRMRTHPPRIFKDTTASVYIHLNSETIKNNLRIISSRLIYILFLYIHNRLSNIKCQFLLLGFSYISERTQENVCVLVCIYLFIIMSHNQFVASLFCIFITLFNIILDVFFCFKSIFYYNFISTNSCSYSYGRG